MNVILSSAKYWLFLKQRINLYGHNVLCDLPKHNKMENRPTYQFDIIRGLMCIMIFNRHFLNLFDNLSIMPNTLLEFFSDSQLGLFYFFTLSGLVITMSFKRKEQSVSKFALKRLLRLFPVVFIAILLGFIFCECGWLFLDDLAQIQPMSNWTLSLYTFDSSLVLALKDIFYTLFCGFSYYDANFWTISFELYTPILILVLFKWFPRMLSFQLCRMYLLLSILLLGFQMSSLYINTVYVLCFLIGGGIALYGDSITIRSRWYMPILIFIGLISFVLPHFLLFRIGNPLKLIGVIVVLYILYRHEYGIFKWMSKYYIFRKLGGVSYEIYAYHLILLVSLSSIIVTGLSKYVSYDVAVLFSYIVSLLSVFVLSIFSSFVTKKFYNPLISKLLKQ